MSVLAKSYDLLLNEGEEGELIYLLELLSCKGWYLQKLLLRKRHLGGYLNIYPRGALVDLTLKEWAD